MKQVFIVIGWLDGSESILRVFSTYEKATAFCDSIPEKTDEQGNVICYPYNGKDYEVITLYMPEVE